MSRHFMKMTTFCLLLCPRTLWAQTTGPMMVALLPMQSERTDRSPISDEQLSTAVLVELTRTGEFQLVESVALEQAVEDGLIDDAVFELLVTGDLAQTLERLDSLFSRTGRRSACVETARRLGAGYAIEVAMRTGRYETEVDYRLTDTNTSRVALAQSFSTSLVNPRNLARETANRVTRDLWKLKYHNQSGK